MIVTSDAYYLCYALGYILRLNLSFSMIWGKDYGDDIRAFDLSPDKSFIISGLIDTNNRLLKISTSSGLTSIIKTVSG